MPYLHPYPVTRPGDPAHLPPAPGWSPDGHRIKAPREYSRGPEKTWVYGGLRVADGHAITMCASSRNSAAYQDFLQLEERANPEGAAPGLLPHALHDRTSFRGRTSD